MKLFHSLLKLMLLIMHMMLHCMVMSDQLLSSEQKHCAVEKIYVIVGPSKDGANSSLENLHLSYDQKSAFYF